MMLHLLPQASPEPRPVAFAEAVSRLASVRHALRLVDMIGDGPASDLAQDEAVKRIPFSHPLAGPDEVQREVAAMARAMPCPPD